MSRISAFSSPFLLGFEHLERQLDRMSKSADGFPPYNIERFPASPEVPETWRLTLAVAGFPKDALEVTVEDRQLTVRGSQGETEGAREYLHRGLGGRSFVKSFVLADGMEVEGAELDSGLLKLRLVRRAAEKRVFSIEVRG